MKIKRTRHIYRLPPEVVRFLAAATAYFEQQVYWHQREVDHRVQARILPFVKTVGGMAKLDEEYRNGRCAK